MCSVLQSLPKSLIFAALAVIASCTSTLSYALTFELPAGNNNVIGKTQAAIVEPGDDFHTIARRYDMGYCELVEANPGIDADNPKPWSTITIPGKFILPNTAHQGIVINLSELRLYYYVPKQNLVMTFPIGIGREGWATPIGQAKVISKTKNPTWTAPASILKDAELRGQPLPAFIPPGPENPLGQYAMHLSIPAYLIHGTNFPDGVGMRSSAGCIRMYPEDIEKLFQNVNVGTHVQIINEAYKVGQLDTQIYLEAHLPLQEQMAQYQVHGAPVNKLIQDLVKNQQVTIDWNKVNQVTKNETGMPTIITQNSTMTADADHAAIEHDLTSENNESEVVPAMDEER